MRWDWAVVLMFGGTGFMWLATMTDSQALWALGSAVSLGGVGMTLFDL